MTLTKSLLLGSAAAIVAVASANAADLPTRKGPVAAEYVRVCSITVAGAPIVGFVLPGSDTCFKISGYVTGQIEGGNLSQAYATNYHNGALYTGAQTIVANSVAGRDSIGYTTRMNTAFDAVSNTAYGPLVSHAEIQIEYGSGFDNTGTAAYINRAYVTWAGITAGRANSFFSFTGGGLAWANFFSPDRKGFNQPDLLAYTASFGGGFAATISLEDPESGTTNPGTTGYLGGNQVGSDEGFLGTGVVNGMRVPDVVAALSLTQAWGSAQISGVAHNVRGYETEDGLGNTIDKWGYAFDAGVQFNIPGAPAGTQIGLTGAYSRNATWYSGIGDGMWDGTANDNGQPIAFADSYYNSDTLNWATPTAWSVTGWAQYQISPQVSLGIEGSYGEITWSGTSPLSMISNEKAALIGGIAHYDPVKNLDFEFELLYEDTKTAQPNGYVAGNGVTTTSNWHGDSNGFAARFEVTRNF